jgi:asparagine N-glycosylation enzyme membrane subunit Stt3
MESTEPGWWHRHGWTVALLLTAFAFAFSIRTIWAYPVIQKWGALYVYAGGSDSYYHSRVMQYIILTGHNLIHDPMLKYPIGGTNPREPLFDWMNAILGLLFAPFFGGNAVVAGAWFLDLQAPLWAALEVFPLYLIGREVSSRRTGLIAALILPFLSASITSSTFGYANYLSFYTFMILVVIYSYIRTVKALGTHRYVDSYRDVRQFVPALRAFYHREHTAVKWGVFTGVSLGALALSWQGYTYAIVVIGFGLLIAMIAERIRRVDSFGLYVTTWIIGLIAIPMMMPYYLVQGDLRTFFDLPVLLLFGVLALMLPFLLMRDIPWVFSLPALALIVGAAALFLKVVLPSYFADVVTGQGYFVKTLIYSTVAEAQPPSFDALVLGYGVATFFLAFVGLAIFVYMLARHRFKRYHIALLVYGVVSLYLPITATKFFLVGAPAYALLSAEALHRALDVGGYPELRRTVASLSDRGSQFAAFRRAFKARHVLVMAVIVLVVLPNVWVAVDAGIPGNTKSAVATQINNSIPSFLKLNNSAPASNYLGATGTDLDTPNQYDFAAYTWLSQQDTNVPEPQRPAFVSWWDYGFQAIDQGDHPSVADNFQNGIDPAGQFLLSQNESLAIAVLATTLLSAELTKTHSSQLPATLDTILANDGVNVSKLESLLANPGSDYNLVVSHPDVYLPVNPHTITDDNAMYLAVSYFLGSSLSLTRVAAVYNSIQVYTGWTIRYAMVDSRLFPFSGSDTGIFYAPADLTGRIINDAGLPTTFFNVTVLGSNNQTYALGTVPAGVASEQYEINYFSPFYNTMLYHTYIGYNGTDVGQTGGIPGLSGAASSDRLEPGWMEQHFEIVYRTAYYCPGVKNASNSSGCMLPTNLPNARSLAKSTNGTLDASALSYFQGGETMLAYYPGETLDGTVALSGGVPDAGVRVTVYDSWGIPHMSTLTNKNGSFSVVLPPGNDTLNLTTGSLDKLTQAGKTLLRSVSIDVPDSIGYSFDAPTVVQRFTLAASTLQGTVYWNTANNTSYDPSKDTVIPGAQVVFTSPGKLTTLTATTDAGGTYLLTNVPPGNYSFSVKFQGRTFNESATLVAPGTSVTASAGLTPASITGTVTGVGGVMYPGATVTLSDPAGIVATVLSDSSGSYRLPPIGPGNYTLLASVPGTLLRSVSTPEEISSTGTSTTAALALLPMAPVSVAVFDHSNPASGIAVRFTPILSFSAGRTTAIGAIDQVTGNGSVAVTGTNGQASLSLPVGNYSVYALGTVSGSLEAAIGTLAVTGGGASASVTLSLAPAYSLSGVVPTIVKTPGATSAVVAYASTGGEVVAGTAANETYDLLLPAGSYDLLALQGTAGVASVSDAALARVNVTGPTSYSLSPFESIAPRFAVYANVSSDTTYPVANATLRISAGPSGPSVAQTSTANGSIAFFLPSTIPLSSGGYCIAGSAPGYVSQSTCGIAPETLGSIGTYRLTPSAVPVTLNVVGLPTGTSVTVNISAKSPTAVVRNLTGGPRFSFALPPGSYSFEAYASADHGAIVYAPAKPLAVRIGFGSSSVTLTLTVLTEILAHGTLSLPSGTTAENTTVTLASSVQNVTVNGTDYLAGFRVSVGAFTASVNATGTLGPLENLTSVTVASGGPITPRLVLTRAGVKLSGTLESASDATLPLNGTIRLLAPGGATITAGAFDGKFTVHVPTDHNFSVAGNFTVSTRGPNGSYFLTWTVVPGTDCVVGTTAASCTVPLVSTRDLSWLNGTIARFGVAGVVPSVLRLVGPYPLTNTTVVAVPNGTFSLHLAPGAYYLYATPSDGSSYAGFTTGLALPLNGGPLRMVLTPSSTDQITVGTSGAPGQTLGLATLTVTGLAGNRVVYPGVGIGSTVGVALPPGAYTLRATAPGTLNGVAGNASAHASVTISLAGNIATKLSLGLPIRSTVRAVLVGPGRANVTTGGSAEFSFAVKDIGNVPVTVHPVGSPAFWTFNFSVANVTLSPGGPGVTGSVRVTVPAGTAVAHPPVAITFELANGTEVGNVTPAPVVTVAGYTGIAIGRTAAHPVGLGADQAEIRFYVHNSGNVEETVEVALANAARLASIGWSYAFGRTNGTPDRLDLAAGSNQSYTLNLTFSGIAFVAPGSATLTASVENVTHGPTASVTVPVTIAKVTVTNSHGSVVTVTGPGIGSSSTYLGEWELLALALIPAGLLVALLLGQRWWATRRWSRW